MSGKGRGRGWMKKDKEIAPGLQLDSNKDQRNDTINKQINIPMKLEYEPIVNAISQFNDTDDGIMINRKCKNINQIMTAACHTPEDAENAMIYLHERALFDDKFIMKFIKFITLPTFPSIHVNDFKLQKAFICKMQLDFENAQSIRQTDRFLFFQHIRLLGYYNSNCNKSIKYAFLVVALFAYLDMLLETAQADEIELFATQLYQSANRIITNRDEKQVESFLNKFSIQIRELLINRNNLTDTSKTWLLFALDNINKEFRMLPSDLMNFYQMKLPKLNNLIASMQALTIQTYDITTPVHNSQSDVNVLELANKSHNSRTNETKSASSPNGLIMKSVDNNARNNIKDFNKTPVVQPGRPILGAGAGRNRKEAASHCEENPCSNGWNPKLKNERTPWSGSSEESWGKKKEGTVWNTDDAWNKNEESTTTTSVTNWSNQGGW